MKKVAILCVVSLLILTIILSGCNNVTSDSVNNKKWVLFVSNRANGIGSSEFNNDIYLMNPSATVVQRLTNNGIYDGEPCWAPDVSQFAFESSRDSNLEIYIANNDGSNPQNLTTEPNFSDKQPSWGPSQIAFVSTRNGGGENIFTMSPSPKSPVNQLTFSYGNTRPAWSPDGQKICYVCQNNIYTMNSDGTNKTQLTTSDVNDYPAWSPDGTKIVYASNPNTDWEIFVIDADGKNKHNLTQSTVRDDIHPSWSQDGNFIYFQSNRDGNEEIYQMNPDGTMQIRITTATNGDNFAPSCYMDFTNP